MSNKTTNFLGTILLAVVFSFFMPWWSVMVAAFLTGLLVPLKKASVFVVPFLAILVYWSVYSFIQSNANDFILAKKISQLLMLGGNPYLLILVTGIVGGLAAGIAGILGKQVSTLRG